MSVVTGIMLLTALSEEDRRPIDEIQAWLDDRHPGNQLVETSDEAGGGKHPQFCAWAAGINYFDEEGFPEFVCSRDWAFPENTILVLQPEEGSSKVYRPAF